MVELLFVYGTLHPDRAPAEILPVVRRLTLLGPATMRGTLHDLGAYPGVTLPGEQIIHGTLFALPENPGVLAALDDYEGFRADDPEGSLFLRMQHAVTLPDGSDRPCWVYLYHAALA